MSLPSEATIGARGAEQERQAFAGGEPKGYVLGHSDHELDRLATQARLVDPITRRVLQAAGVGGALRVLDVGCGAGDLTFLLADMLGQTGSVLGVDRSGAALAVARNRAQAQRRRALSFLEAEVGDLPQDLRFDAIVGRYVLVFQPDPAALVRKLTRHLVPGGVMVFHEVDFSGERSFPSAPNYELACAWVEEALLRSGFDPHLGLRLPEIFAASGLPFPQMHLESLIGGPDDLDLIRFKVDLVRTLLPQILRLGIASESEVAIDTLAQRIRDEMQAGGSVILGRSEIGAWAKTGYPA